MTRLVLILAALAVALAQNDPETTAAPPPEEPVKNKEEGSGESATPPQPQCVSLGGGMVTFEVYLGTEYNLASFTPTVAAQFQALVATTVSASSSHCVALGSVGLDKRDTPYFSVTVTGLVSGAASVTALYSTVAFDTFFGTSVTLASLSSYDVAPTDPSGATPRDKEGTPGTNFDAGGGTAANPCETGATGSLSAVLHFPGFDLANYNEAHTGIIIASIAYRIGANPLCIAVLGTAIDVNGVPFAHISATALWDAAAASTVLSNSEFSDISSVFGVTATISDIRITTASVAPKEDPVTSAPAIATTAFDYDSLLPMAIDNIDRATGSFTPAFLQRVVEGCAHDSRFCSQIMNILTSYISLLAAPTGAPPVDKEGSAYSTGSASSGSGLSLGAVLAISGSALVAVVVVAMVALKIKTGRFVPSRPSSRVSVSSDTRALTSHSSRISVRAWPNAMEV